MFWLDLVVIGLLAVGVIVWVGEPLLRRSGSLTRSSTADKRESLLLQKEVLYTAIGDLTFDFHTSKVDESDYTALRQELESEAMQVLHSLDALDAPTSVDDEIERQVSALRQAEPGVSARLPEQVCSSCHRQLHGHENFCPACGQAITLL